MYKQISMAEAKEVMSTEKDYILLDARTQEEYADGHIPGAICVPNETIGTEPPVELPDKEKKILVYCRSGNRSRQAAAKLAAMGYSNIVEFGGIMDWNGEIEK
jgi:rhodanese-related sulfurtransferase